MLKIFSTQLQGLFSKITEKEDTNIEEAARLLAQAVISDGKLYLHGFREMDSIVTEATLGAEPLPSSARLFNDGNMAEITELDRVLLVSRFSTDEEVLSLAKKLTDQGIQTVGISAIKPSEVSSLEQIVDIHIDSKLLKPLIPDEDGSRYGFPAVMTALFAYYGLSFTIKEIINEY